jgi:hypothetical protein
MNNKMKNETGSTALFLVLVMMSSFFLITLTAADIARNGLKMSGSQLDSTKAYYAAEAGAEKMIWEIRKNGFNTAVCNPSGEKIDFDIGSCNVDCCTPAGRSYSLTNSATYTIEYKLDTPTTTLMCAGGFKDLERKIQLKY